jgi:hypothetical protein
MIESDAYSEVKIKKPRTTDEHNYHKKTLAQQSYVLACQRGDDYAIDKSLLLINEYLDRCNKTID